MKVPDDLRYSSDHEWVRVEGSRVVVGITDYAQDALGDVVFVQLPVVGVSVASNESISEVESTKSVSDIYAPLAGTIVEVNAQLADEPNAVNDDPYGAGWMFVIELSDPTETEGLLSPAAYRSLTEG